MNQFNIQFIDKFLDILQPAEVISEVIRDDGTFPNNDKLPLLLFKSALKLPQEDAAMLINEIFQVNKWGNSWLWALYAFQHYHSTAHEVLGIYSGWVDAQFGGPEGQTLKASAGDVIIIPAGVAHKNLDQSQGFRVVGAYPRGQMWDMNYGRSGERPSADERIKKVPLPVTDPVHGKSGPLLKLWQQR